MVSEAKGGSAIQPPGSRPAARSSAGDQPAARGCAGDRPDARGSARDQSAARGSGHGKAGASRGRSPALGLLLWGAAAVAAGLASALAVALAQGFPLPAAAATPDRNASQPTADATPGRGAPHPAAAATPDQDGSHPAADGAAPAPPGEGPASAAASAAPAPPGESPAPGAAGTPDLPGWPDPVHLARTFVQLAARGNPAVAATLLPEREVPYGRLADLGVLPEEGGALLPGPEPGAGEQVLLPVTYRRSDRRARGYLRVLVAPVRDGYRVAGLQGPIAPREDWQPFDLPLQDANRRPLPALEGPAVLWTPRRPEPGLVEAMEGLRQSLAGQVAVLMAVDLATPGGWDRTARAQGWQGPVVYVRGYLDRYPLPGDWPLLGARGVLVHPDGRVVGSLGELDPARYGLSLERLPELALRVLQGYGLLRPPG